MAYNVIGTSYEQPFYYQQRMAQAGQALGSFMDAFRRRREEKESQEKEEINNAFKAISTMPELADTWGTDLERKYGQKYPEIPQILAVVRQRRRLAQELPQAQEAYYSALSGLEQDYAAQQERVARMPDAVPAQMPFNPFMATSGGFFDLPNPEKAAAERSLSQVRPELFPIDALGKLPSRQRDQARVVLKNQGIELPDQTPFDAFGDLTPKAKGALAVDRGYIPPDSVAAKVIKGEGEVELTEAEKEKQEFTTSEREAREAAQAEQREESDRLQRGRILLQDALRAAADRRQIAGQKEIIDYRQSKKGSGSESGKENAALPWKAIVSDSKAAVDDWDDRHKQAVPSSLEGSARQTAEDKFVAKNGPRPKPIGEVAARRIAREVRNRKLGGSEADAALVEISSSYMAERGRGASEQEALSRALGKSKAPTVRDRLTAAKGDEAAVYMQLMEEGATPEEANRQIAEARKAPGKGAPAKPAPKTTANKAKPAPQTPLFSEVKDERWRAFAAKEYADQIADGVAPDVAKRFVDDLLRSRGQLK